MNAILLAATLAATNLQQPPKPFTFDTTVEGVYQYSLPNGLKVVLVPDESSQKTTVNMNIFVGSRNEGYGEKGMAHLLEHMLFKGTPSHPDPKKELTLHAEDANGTTWFDRTNYYETVKATDKDVEWAIRFEADRLINSKVDKKDLDSEMTVVRNEWEIGENNPVSVLSDRVMATAYTWHNYANTTIGDRSDVEKVPIDNLKAFYKKYYRPDNTMLVVAGKLDPDKTFKWIADSFGKLTNPKVVLAGTWTEEPVQDGEKSVTVRRVGGVPVLQVGYHVPAGADPDFPAVDVLTNVLGDSPAGRLYTALVATKKAAGINCSDYQLKEPGFFWCTVELHPTDKMENVRQLTVDTIEGLLKKPVTAAEVERAKTAELKGIELILNDSTRIGLTLTECAAMGDWRLLYFMRDRLKGVTADDVNRVAAKYFKQSNRTTGEYVPTEHPDRSEVPPAPNVAQVLKDFHGSQKLAEGEAFQATPDNIEAKVQRTQLSNGMKLALMPKKNRGERLNLMMAMRFGSAKALDGKRGASDMLARMLIRGTTKHDRIQFEDELNKLNAQLHFTPIPQGLAVTLEVRKPQLSAALDLMAEALTSPALDPKEFETFKREVLTGMEQQKNDPTAVGFNALQKAVAPYPKGHPFYVESFDEIIDDVNKTTLPQLKDFHTQFYGADHTQLAIVGDIDVSEVKGKLESLFGKWSSKTPFERVHQDFQKVAADSKTVQMNDKANAFFGAGLTLPMKEGDADYPAMVAANFMLGGGFLTGRVTQRLREKEGLSYGAGTVFRAPALDDGAVMLGYAMYKPENASKVEAGFNEEMARAVKDGFVDKEVKEAMPGLIQERESTRANDNELAQLLVRYLYIDRTLKFDKQLDEELAKLDGKKVSAALKAHVDPKGFWEIKAGDFKTVQMPK